MKIGVGVGPCFGQALAPAASPELYYILNEAGDSLYVRGSISPTKDVVQVYRRLDERNENFNIGTSRIVPPGVDNTIDAWTDGTIVVADGGDEIGPVCTDNVGSIAENHGLTVPVVTSTGHDKTSADLGSRWRVDGWIDYLLVGINGDALTFWPVPSGNVNDGTWIMWNTDPWGGSTMTWVSGGTHHETITITSKLNTQMYPVVKNNIRQMLRDGVTEIEAGEEGGAAFIDLVNEYDLVDPSTLDTANDPMEWNDGSIWLHARVVLRALAGCTVYHTTYTVLRPLKLDTSGYLGVLQTTLPSGSYYTHQDRYIPKALPSGGYDFAAIQRLDTNPAGYLIFKADTVEAGSKPTDRELILFKVGNESQYALGLAFGYIPILSAIPGQRIAGASAGFWNISPSRKSYPVCLGSAGVIDDVSVEVYAYRLLFDPTVHSAGKLTYGVSAADRDFVFVDYHQAVTNDVTELPSRLVGKAIQVLDSKDVQISQAVVPEAGISLSTVGAATQGFIVLELVAASPAAPRQTLCPASGRTLITDLWAEGATTPVTQTAAQARDASDDTYDRYGRAGFEGDPTIGTIALTWTLEACACAGSISKVRVRIRARRVTNGAGTATIVPYFAGSDQGTPVDAGATVGWREFDFVTNPLTSSPWTAAAINAMEWGWASSVLSGETGDDYCDVYAYEYEVQVWG